MLTQCSNSQITLLQNALIFCLQRILITVQIKDNWACFFAECSNLYMLGCFQMSPPEGNVFILALESTNRTHQADASRTSYLRKQPDCEVGATPLETLEGSLVETSNKWRVPKYNFYSVSSKGFSYSLSVTCKKLSVKLLNLKASIPVHFFALQVLTLHPFCSLNCRSVRTLEGPPRVFYLLNFCSSLPDLIVAFEVFCSHSSLYFFLVL